MKLLETYKVVFIVFGLVLSLSGFGQQRALTDSGDEVILYPDGTWDYLLKVSEDSIIHENPNEFVKSAEAGFYLKSKKFNIGFHLDPKKWIVKKAVSNEDAEYEMQMKERDVFGMIISEEIEIPLLTLRDIALSNAMSVAPDMRIVHQEFRKVNGLQVLSLMMTGTSRGIKFTYFGYYFTCKEGTVQFLTYSSQNVMEENHYECEKFLNGIAIYEE